MNNDADDSADADGADDDDDNNNNNSSSSIREDLCSDPDAALHCILLTARK